VSTPRIPILTEEQQEIIDLFLPSLPRMIARERVSHLLGFIIDQKTLRNADSRGEGPAGAVRIGRKVVYRTENLLLWIVQKYGVSKIEDQKSIFCRHK